MWLLKHMAAEADFAIIQEQLLMGAIQKMVKGLSAVYQVSFLVFFFFFFFFFFLSLLLFLFSFFWVSVGIAPTRTHPHTLSDDVGGLLVLLMPEANQHLTYGWPNTRCR